MEAVMTGHTGLGSFAIALVVGGAALSGCASSYSPSGAQSPSEQATAFKQTRCSGGGDDAVVADILNGKAVESVMPFYSGGGSKTSNSRLLGVTVYVRPSAGETAEWLNRALECHSAQQTSERTAMMNGADPFFLPDAIVKIRVRSSGDGFKIDVEGSSSADAREILSRASAFAGATGASKGLAVQPELP
jgi:hypothetical protein